MIILGCFILYNLWHPETILLILTFLSNVIVHVYAYMCFSISVSYSGQNVHILTEHSTAEHFLTYLNVIKINMSISLYDVKDSQ